MKLGRAYYDAFRFSEGYYDEDGLWKDNDIVKVRIRANIQGGLFWNSVKFSDSGDIAKLAISIRSDEPLYIANQGRKGDIVSFDGSLWEVRDTRIYKNLRSTRHWESMAVLVDSSVVPRELL